MKDDKHTRLGVTVSQVALAFAIFILPTLIAPIIWPREIKSPTLFLFWIGPTVNLLSLLISNLFFLILYKLNHPAIERFKCNSQPWPWQETPKEWPRILLKTVMVVGFYNLIIVPSVTSIVVYYDIKQPNVDWKALPTISEYITHLLICIIAEDFMFYFGHRLLHSKYLYKYIHKVHHEHTVVFSLASEYCHPLEFLIANVVPYATGPFLLSGYIHCYTHMCWIVIRIFEGSVAHSGYDFPVSLSNLFPLTVESDFHNYHHLNFKDNYGSFFKIWDYICGTVNKDYKISVKKGL
jgi:sterol desaturase/sphingolipid hydroxylase (fatty acid hydroxylase superfamily)